MADVSIKNSAGVTFTFENGEVDSVRSEIVAQPDVIPMPGSAPRDAIIIDLGGCTKQITVTGFLRVSSTTRTDQSTTTTSILDQKRWLEALLDGSQSVAVFTSNYESYTSDGSGSGGWGDSPPVVGSTTTKVVVTRINFEERTGDPGSLAFTMTLRVGS